MQVTCNIRLKKACPYEHNRFSNYCTHTDFEHLLWFVEDHSLVASYKPVSHFTYECPKSKIAMITTNPTVGYVLCYIDTEDGKNDYVLAKYHKEFSLDVLHVGDLVDVAIKWTPSASPTDRKILTFAHNAWVVKDLRLTETPEPEVVKKLCLPPTHFNHNDVAERYPRHDKDPPHRPDTGK